MNFSRGVGGSLSHLWKFRRGGGAISSLQKWKIQGGGSQVRFPPWWGSGYFLELHDVTFTMRTQRDRSGAEHASSVAENSTMANLMMMDVHALTRLFSFEKIFQKQVDKHQDKSISIEEARWWRSFLSDQRYTTKYVVQSAPFAGQQKPFASIAAAVGSNVTPKL